MNERLTIGWAQLVIFILSFIGVSLVVGVVGGIIEAVLNKEFIESLFLGYKGIWLDTLFFVIVFLLFGKVRSFILQSFDFAPLKKWSTYGIILVGLAIFTLTQFILLDWLELESAKEQADSLDIAGLTGGLDYLLFFLGAAILTPIKEEMLFRGLLHRFFELKYHFILGLLVSSIVFGILHIGFPISATIMGAVFVLVYKYTNSLVPSIILHMIWNSIAFVNIFFQ